MSSGRDLLVDWCSHEAAEFAVRRWHYSRTMPVSKSARLGVWEHGEFIGAVLFAWGANPNLGRPFGLDMLEVAELVRVALREHATPVSRIISIAVRMLRRQSPGLRLLVSFADTDQNHVGAIYQASNWTYLGTTPPKFDYVLAGRKLQRRAYTGKNFGQPRLALPAGALKVRSPVKHRYTLALDDEIRARIAPLARPYPKRADHG